MLIFTSGSWLTLLQRRFPCICLITHMLLLRCKAIVDNMFFTYMTIDPSLWPRHVVLVAYIPGIHSIPTHKTRTERISVGVVRVRVLEGLYADFWSICDVYLLRLREQADLYPADFVYDEFVLALGRALKSHVCLRSRTSEQTPTTTTPPGYPLPRPRRWPNGMGQGQQ